MRIILAAALLLAVTPLFTAQVAAVLQTNTVANPGFENSASNPWHRRTTYGNGTVNIYDNTRAHSGSYSSMLAAINKTACPSDCKDSVGASVEQYVQSPSPPTLNHLDNTNDSFSAWWYVAASTGLPTYSLHIGLLFNEGSSIEYWYGTSDLSNSTTKYTSAAYNLGPFPLDSWFQLSRNLTADIQGVVANPSSARVTTIWFATYGGTYNSTPHGETGWVDDVALKFNAGPVAVFSSNPASGTAPLTVRFNASQSYQTGGSSASIVNYQWSFGDGSATLNTTSPSTTHTYGSPGTFPVTVTITDSYGAESTSSSKVTVGPSDVTIPLLVGGGGGVLLLGGILFKFRRRPSKIKKTKPKMRKG